MRENNGEMTPRLYTPLLLLLAVLLPGCGESDKDREEKAARFTTSTRPAPNPQRESLESLVRQDLSAPSSLPGAPRYQLFSAYAGEDIRQVTGVSGRTLLLCFTAPWCPHCTRMRQELQQLAEAEKGNVQVVEVNADAYPVLAEEFHITKVPTTIFYTEGVRLRAIEGAYNAKSLQNFLHNILSQGEKAAR